MRDLRRMEIQMTVHLSHPEGLLQQSDYAPVALATGSRLLMLAGQAAVTPAGDVTAACPASISSRLPVASATGA